MSSDSVNPDDLAAKAENQDRVSTPAVNPATVKATAKGAEKSGAAVEATAASAAPAVATKGKSGPAARKLGWPAVTVAIIFAVFYAYDLWEGISTLVSLPAYYSASGLDVGPVWWILIAGVLLPIIVYGIAFLVGLRQKLPGKALIFLVGLAVVAALSLGLIAFEQILRPTLLGG